MDRSDKIRASLDSFRAQVDAFRDGDAVPRLPRRRGHVPHLQPATTPA